MLRDYPTTPALEDDTAIAQLVAIAREKGRGSSDDPYSAMEPSSFRTAGGGGASGGSKEREEADVEADDESEKPAKGSSRPKKGFFSSIFS